MFKYLVLATVLAVSPACKKQEESAPRSAVTEGSGSAATGSGGTAGTAGAAGSATASTPDASADFVAVYANHAKPKPDDPVAVKFEKFTVTNAAFDPANLEGGTATIELDLASLGTGSSKRDGHLKSPAYIDVSKFTTATIDIANVKKQADRSYTADAKVAFRGVEKTYPVAFEVLETKDDGSVRIRGEHTFPRMDFNVGQDPSNPDESVAPELTIKLQLTLKKT